MTPERKGWCSSRFLGGTNGKMHLGLEKFTNRGLQKGNFEETGTLNPFVLLVIPLVSHKHP